MIRLATRRVRDEEGLARSRTGTPAATRRPGTC